MSFGSPEIPIAFAQSPLESTPIAQAQEEQQPENSEEETVQLKLGDEGEIVTELQNRLKQLGHYEGELTGKYDEKTQEAVAKFQTSQKLEPTGIFDEAAFDKLRDLQNIPTPRRRQPPRRRPWGWKRKLVFIGGGGLVLLIGMGGSIVLLLRYINRGYQPNEQEIDEGEIEESEEIKLTELYPISQPLRKAETLVKEDELEHVHESDVRESDIHESDRPETETFPPPFPTAPVSEPPADTWQESPSPSFADNHPFAPEVAPGDRSSLTPSFARETPYSHPNLIKSPLDPIEELIRELHSHDPDRRTKAIWELAQRADSRAVQPLVSLLLESDSHQQSLILEALSQIGTRTLKPMNRALALSLQDDNAQVRKNAIRDLTRVYTLIAQLSQLIYYATDDPDPEVQETAKWALGQLSHIRMLPSDRNHE